MWLICGLGNPERRYIGTRHNAGFAALDLLLHELGDLKLCDTKFQGACVKTRFFEEGLLLLKPLTYMNESGRCIAPLSNFYRIPPERIIVISDEIELPPGQIRVRARGSAGGHNGLKSVISCLGTENFPRVRIGVGEKPEYMDLADYVLGKIPSEEEKTMAEAYQEAAEACLDIISKGVDKSMNLHNAKRK